MTDRYKPLAGRSFFQRTTGSALGVIALFGTLALVTPLAAQTVITGGTMDGGETVFNPVLATEWNVDGDFEGWTTDQTDDAKVEAGVLSGVSNANDPKITIPGGSAFVIGGNPGEVSRVQYAAQLDPGAPFRKDIFFFTSEGFFRHPWNEENYPGITNGELHTFNIDFDSSSPLWGLTVNNLRIDPDSDSSAAGGVTYAFDYFRLGSQVPEPASVGLCTLGVLGLALARSRGRRPALR